MSKLTFIVPVYKPDHKYLEKCVRSLLVQSLTDWDAVFVFDGPDKDAANKIESLFKKSTNHYKLVDIEHGGACRARNEGFKHAKGDYVVFWDCDSAIEPHAAKNWCDILDKNHGYGFVYSGYKFFDEQGAINSEPFDPYLLRVANYISTCFPLRRELVGPGWNEALESAQDWDFWLGVVERGGVGKYLEGHAFSTAYPTPTSISGKGCSPEKWLERQDRVRELHGIKSNEVCVTSLEAKHDGIALAKLIGADYHDRPNDKPNHYKTIIQVGFSLNAQAAELCATAWGPEHKKIIYWTRDNVDEIYNAVSLRALSEYSSRLNIAATQFVDDRAAQKIMEKAGFKTEVSPLPMANTDETPALPEKPRFIVDAAAQYGHVIAVIRRALPDVRIDLAGGVQKIEDYTGILHFYVDRALSSSVKRMELAGRHVVSNIQSPFTGFLDDATTDERFVVSVVERIRQVVKKGPNDKGRDYWQKSLSTEKLLEAIK